MTRITVSLPGDQYDWLAAEAKRAGVSMTSILQALVDAAKNRGWQVEPQPAARVSSE